MMMTMSPTESLDPLSLSLSLDASFESADACFSLVGCGSCGMSE